MPLVQTDAERLAAFPAVVDAVTYLLDRAQTDAEVGYRIGPGTEAFRRLCLAEAAAGRAPPQVERERGRSRVSLHAVVPLERECDEWRIELLEAHVSQSDLTGVEVELERRRLDYIERELTRRGEGR